MKLKAVFFFSVLSIFAFSAKSEASPLYYTFEGSLTSSYDEIGGVVDPFVAAGSLRFVVMLDFEQAGEIHRNDGSVTVLEDSYFVQSWRRESRDYFFADLLCGTVMQKVGNGCHNSPHQASESNYGEIFKREHYADGPNGTDALTGNDLTNAEINLLSTDEHLMLRQLEDGSTPGYVYWQDPDFSIGAEWISMQTVYNELGDRAVLYGQLTITGISETAPDCDGPAIPEPCTMLLFGAGLLGLAGSCVRKR